MKGATHMKELCHFEHFFLFLSMISVDQVNCSFEAGFCLEEVTLFEVETADVVLAHADGFVILEFFEDFDCVVVVE